MQFGITQCYLLAAEFSDDECTATFHKEISYMLLGNNQLFCDRLVMNHSPCMYCMYFMSMLKVASMSL